jgi:solute carrier family 25 (mitochondrial phosphate transporter), member 23/24/25/41
MSAQPPTSSSRTPPNPLKTYPPSSSSAPSNSMSDPLPSAATSASHGFKAWVSQAVVASFIAGGVAGAVSRTVVSPLERLKILLQVQSTGHTEYKMSISKALAKIWREEGFKGMMAGNGTNCIRIVPYSAVQFGSYNLYKPV